MHESGLFDDVRALLQNHSGSIRQQFGLRDRERGSRVSHCVLR